MRTRLVLLAVVAAAIAGCHTDMWAQPQTRALEPSPLFPDGKSARPIPIGSVPYDPTAATGNYATGEGVKVVPVSELMRRINANSLKNVLLRGEERFNVFCSPCHGRVGDGRGMIAQRGLDLVTQPRNFHSARILESTDGHIFKVITNGYRNMFSYGDRVPVDDRWCIVAYIRALELSENAGPEGRS